MQELREGVENMKKRDEVDYREVLDLYRKADKKTQETALQMLREAKDRKSSKGRC